MALVIGDCEKIRTKLMELQQAKYDNTIATPTHGLTRFGIVHMICEALVESKDAPRSLVKSADWDEGELKYASSNGSYLDNVELSEWGGGWVGGESVFTIVQILTVLVTCYLWLS